MSSRVWVAQYCYREGGQVADGLWVQRKDTPCSSSPSPRTHTIVFPPPTDWVPQKPAQAAPFPPGKQPAGQILQPPPRCLERGSASPMPPTSGAQVPRALGAITISLGPGLWLTVRGLSPVPPNVRMDGVFHCS